MVTVRFFASLRQIIGTSEMEMKIQVGTPVGQVFQELKIRFPELGKYQAVLLVAVNQEYANFETLVSSGDEIAFFPPVSGGRP